MFGQIGGVNKVESLEFDSDMYWDVSGGPAFVRTKYYSVEAGSSRQSSSAAAEFSTVFEYDITNDIEFIYNYKFTVSNAETGRFKHHMVTTLENELTDWLDLVYLGLSSRS